MKNIFYALIICTFISPYKDAHAENTDFFKYGKEINLYNEDQPNAKALKKCAFSETKQFSCLLIESPLIGLEAEQVSVEDIMNRTMASRKSYLQTFKSVLEMMPQEVLTMFGSVNAVVISERIKPSFYSYTSGAIYISADYLWTTTEEKESTRVVRDSRESFGNPLKVSEETDYYKKGESITKLMSLKKRTPKDLVPLLLKVLVHELTHANDFFPKSFYTSKELPTSKTFHEAAMAQMDEGALLSYKTFLNSTSTLSRFSEIFDYGKEATEIEKKMDPKYIVHDYIDGSASDLYAYANAREDLAMMVENNLMYYFLGYKSRTVFIEYPHADFIIPSNYKKPIVGGVFHKIAAPEVKDRGMRMLKLIFEESFVDKVQEKLDKSEQKIIPKGMSWKKVNQLSF